MKTILLFVTLCTGFMLFAFSPDLPIIETHNAFLHVEDSSIHYRNRIPRINSIEESTLCMDYVLTVDTLTITTSPVYKVTSCQFVFAPKEGQPIVFKVLGNKLPQKAINRIRNGQLGDRIIIDQIRVKSANGNRTLLPIMYELVQ